MANSTCRRDVRKQLLRSVFVVQLAVLLGVFGSFPIAVTSQEQPPTDVPTATPVGPGPLPALISQPALLIPGAE